MLWNARTEKKISIVAPFEKLCRITVQIKYHSNVLKADVKIICKGNSLENLDCI